MHQRATGVHVAKVLPCEGDYIVLLDYHPASQVGLSANLRRARSNCYVVWAASTPSSSDLLTDVEWRDGRLIAWTWECFMITVDLGTGQFVEKVFAR